MYTDVLSLLDEGVHDSNKKLKGKDKSAGNQKTDDLRGWWFSNCHHRHHNQSNQHHRHHDHSYRHHLKRCHVYHHHHRHFFIIIVIIIVKSIISIFCRHKMFRIDIIIIIHILFLLLIINILQALKAMKQALIIE